MLAFVLPTARAFRTGVSLARWSRMPLPEGAARIALAGVVLWLAGPGTRAEAQLIAWDITSTTGSNSGTAPGVLAVGLSASTLQSGSALTTGNSTSPANTWNRTYPTAFTTAEDSMAGNQFLFWTTTVDAGYSASFTGLTGLSLSRTSVGPTSAELWFSRDGQTYERTGGIFTVGTTLSSAAATFSSTMATTPIVLDGGETGATLTWRLVPYGGASRFGIGRTASDDFSMLGTVSGGAAKNLSWVGTDGAGVWNTDPSNLAWAADGQPAAFLNNDNVAFARSGSVTVSGPVAAGDMTVSHAAGTLEITGDFGATTLTKSGNGGLTLSGTNSFSGGVSLGGGSVVVASAQALGTGSVAIDGAVLSIGEAVTTLSNLVTVGSGGATVGNAGDVVLSGAISGPSGSRLLKTGAGTLTLSAGLGAQITAPLQVDLAEGTTVLRGAQKNVTGAAIWSGNAILESGTLMMHGGSISGSGTMTVAGTTAPLYARLDRGTAEVGIPIVVEDTLRLGSPAGNNLLRISGPISGPGGVLAEGNGTKHLFGANTYEGPTRLIGSNSSNQTSVSTLLFGTRASLYNGDTSKWTAANLTIEGRGQAVFRVGGEGEFTAADLEILLPLNDGSGGFLSGSRVGLDTTSGDFLFAGSITDPNFAQRSFAKSGVNSLTLTGTNTYTGPTLVNGGTLVFGGTSALYGGAWSASNLSVASGATAAFRVGGDEAFSSEQVDQLAGQAGFAAGSSLGIDTTGVTGTFSYGNVIADRDGAIGLTKIGTGTLALTGVNAYSGPTRVSGGTLQLASPLALGVSSTLVINGGTVDLGGHSIGLSSLSGDATGAIINSAAGSTSTLSVTVASGTVTFAGSIDDGAGVVALEKSGGGRLALTGGSTYSGGTRLDTDVLVANASALGRGGVTATGPNARIFWTGDAASVTLANPLVTGATIADALAFVPGVDKTVVIAGPISGQGQIKISSSTTGTLDLTRQTALTNTNLGGVEIGNGRVLIDNGANLGLGTVNFGTQENSRLVIAGPNVTVSNPVTIGTTGSPLAAGSARFDTNGNVLNVTGVVADRPGNPAGNLVKLGAGTLVLSAANTYGGTTLVQQGVLLVNGDQSAATGSVTVGAAGTLGGTGTVGGATAIGGGATLAPGASPGTLTFAGNVTLTAGGNYNWEIHDAAGTAGSTTGWDLISVGGGLDIAATSESRFNLNLWSLSGVGPDVNGPAINWTATQGYTWKIASAAGGITGFDAGKFTINTAATNGTAGFANDLAGGSFSVAVSGNDLNLVFTPGSGPSQIVIDVPSGSQTQAQAGYPTIATAASVTKIGAGSVVFDAANAYTGPTTVSAGTLQVANANALAATTVTVDTGATLAVASGTTMKAPAVIVDGGTLSAATVAVNSATGIASLAINAGTVAGSPVVSIDAGGQMSLAQDARVSVAVGGLSVAETSGGGRLDLGAGQVTIAAGGISAADLRADIIAARNGGAWNGTTGITSSTAAASGGTRAVGYVVAGDGSARVSFAASGDVDLSGAVNVFDLVSINSSGTYGSGAPSVWSKGDFNYDGVTNVFDLVGVNTAGVYGQGNYFPAAPTTTALTAVPEPAAGWAAALTMLGGLAAWRRRAGSAGRR